MCLRIITVSFVVVFSSARVAHAVTVGQVDTFEIETSGLAGWTVGNPTDHPNPPVWFPNGGPQGTFDSYIQVEGDGESGPGSKPNVFNASQWAGDYLAAGVTAIALDTKYSGNGPETMRLRIGLEGPLGFAWSLHAEPVQPGTPSPWRHVVFRIDPLNLGGGDAVTVLGNVTKMWLYHSPLGDTPRNSPALDAQIGYDNIRAVAWELLSSDFDEDGDVDGDDFLIWQSGFGVDDGGDTDNDGDTDGDDFLIWQTEFGSGSSSASNAVPEPSSVVLLLVALLGAAFLMLRRCV